MDVSEKKSTKVASQLPWRVKSIDNLEKNFKHLKGKIQFKFITSGILKGLHLVWNTETNVKSFRLVGKSQPKAPSKNPNGTIPNQQLKPKNDNGFSEP